MGSLLSGERRAALGGGNRLPKGGRAGRFRVSARPTGHCWPGGLVGDWQHWLLLLVELMMAGRAAETRG